jgi:2-polyprenyl-3-methyl-5-hydroxy-6-metoxy-1,4-benzoquinol methylase
MTDIKSFEDIYKKKIWGKNNESGTGSNYSIDNQKLVRKINDIVKEYNIKTICDYGCGNFNTMKHLQFDDILYHGIDIVDSVISTNQTSYQRDNVKFFKKTREPTDYDLIIIKDVLQHHQNQDVINTLQQLIDNNRYVFCINGFRYMKQQTNFKHRNINNKYRYYPLHSNDIPLKDFKDYELKKYKHRMKEYILYHK